MQKFLKLEWEAIAGLVAAVIAHTPRGKKTRIISMRKANNREQKIYQERLETP